MPEIDKIKHASSSTSPGEDVVEVTPSDTDNLPGGPCRGLLIGTAGTVDIISARGNERLGVPLVVGWNPIGCIRVMTGSTAADIWAVY